MNQAHPPKNQPSPTGADWHPADIVAALRKAGWSLRRLSQQHGLAPPTLRHAIARSWPRGERLIAQAIGVRPETIWPERFAARAAKAAARASSARRTPTTKARRPRAGRNA